jgi:hypothetical protein
MKACDEVEVALAGGALAREHVEAVAVAAYKFFLYSRCQIPALFDDFVADQAALASSTPLPSSTAPRRSRVLAKFVADTTAQLEALVSAAATSSVRRLAFLLGAAPALPVDAMVLDFRSASVLLSASAPASLFLPQQPDAVARVVLRQLFAQHAAREKPREFGPKRIFVLAEATRQTPIDDPTFLPKQMLAGESGLPFRRCSVAPSVARIIATAATVA